MTRQQFDHSLGVRQPYLSLVFARLQAGLSWNLINQGRTLSPDATSDTQEYARIGDNTKRQIAGPATIAANVQVYVEDNLKEVALFLGTERPGSGWVGNERLQFDPTVKLDLMVINYDGVTASALPTFVEYLNEWAPSSFSMNLEAEGDVRIAEFQGACAAWYLEPVAGL